MAQAILTTKLFMPPARSELVARPLLTARLNEGLRRKLTIVAAPAGFGKTTLVSDWASRSGRPVAWLALDEGDRHPTRFLTYLVTALRTVMPDAGAGALAALQSPQPPPAEAIMTSLVNDLAVAQEDSALILDDYHLAGSAAVDDALTFLIENLPPRLHLVLTTREDPRLPLPRLRARDQLTELRAADLRFSTSEAAEFLKGVMNLSLSSDDIATLESRTEGWIAGLQLAALSMQGREDVAGFIRSFSGDNRHVVDYLVDEVLKHQPPAVRSFLLETSVLERLTGPLCDEVTGLTDGGSLLEALERDNLFVVPLDDTRTWYRYHHLFADVLRRHAREEHAALLPEWHRRASDWLARNGLPHDAIRHALLAGDFDRAANLVEAEAMAMLAARQDETLVNWLRALPDEVVKVRPVLSVYYALALLPLDFAAAEERLRDAERGRDLTSGGDPPPGVIVVDQQGFRSLAGVIEIVRAYLSGALGDITATVRHAQRARDVLPEDATMWRAASTVLYGLAQWRLGELDIAYRSMAEGSELLRATGDVVQSMSGTFDLAVIRSDQGRLNEAEETLQQALQLAATHFDPLPGTALDLYVGLSELSRERNDLEAAARYLALSNIGGAGRGIPEYRHRWYVARARLEEAHGRPDSALEALDQAERLYIPSPDPEVRPIAALRARVHIRMGRLAEARSWAQDQRLSTDDELSYLREFEHITLARLLMAEMSAGLKIETFDDVMAFLAHLLHAAESGGRGASVIEVLLLQALLHETAGDTDSALVPFERALALAEPQGYTRIFIDESAPVARLLSAAGSRPGSQDYASRLLAAMQSETPPAERAQDPPLIEPLSARELEVLRLISEGLSNREIGERLFVTVNTVKGHNRLIFDKLQVRRRTEAIARARELGLV